MLLPKIILTTANPAKATMDDAMGAQTKPVNIGGKTTAPSNDSMKMPRVLIRLRKNSQMSSI